MAKKKKHQYKVRTANLYVGHANPQGAIKHLIAGRPHVVAVQEASPRWQKPLRNVEGYYYVGARKGSRGKKENGLLIREDVRLVGFGFLRLSAEIPGDKLGHDRWAVWARIVLPGGVPAAAYSTHKNAGIQGKLGRPGNGRRAQEFVLHTKREQDLVSSLERRGWPVIGGQDGNYRVPKGVIRTRAQAWRYSPHKSLPAVGVAYIHHRLDGILFSKRAFRRVGSLHTLPPNVHLSDHDWLTQKVRVRPKHLRLVKLTRSTEFVTAQHVSEE